MSRPTNPPTDDPATLRARLQERYEHPDLGTLDNGEPVRTPPQKVWRVVDGVGAWWWFWPDTDCFGALVGEHEHPAYPRPERPCTYDPADEEPEAEPVADREVIIPARPEYTPGPWRATYIVRFEGEAYSCADCPTCKAPIFMLAGTGIPTTGGLDAMFGIIARNTDWTPHTCPTVDPPITDTTDPEWVRQIHGAPPGQPVRLLAAGSADDYTAEMAEHRATLYRAQGYTDVSVSVFRPEPQPPREECPACGEYGWHDSRCDLDSYHLRSYLRTLTNPDAPAEDVAAALDLLTDEDRELVAALTKRNP